MISILNAEPLNYSLEAKAILASVGEVHEQNLTREELIASVSDFDVLIVRLKFQIDRAVMDAAGKLKVIVTATTGLDHIDVEYAASRGIEVLSLKGETAFLRSVPATAEHTWGLLLALVRNIPAAFESVLRHEWSREAFRGHDLCGRRLGIVGLGRIGEKVARYADAFGMEVHAYDPYRIDWRETVIRHHLLEALLDVADVLSIHAPLTSETRYLIGEQQLERLPPGAVMINTARGDLVDGEALLQALRAGKVAGAALDVIPGERDAESTTRQSLITYARSHANLILTPHIGGATYESMSMTEVFMARKLVAWVQSSMAHAVS